MKMPSNLKIESRTSKGYVCFYVQKGNDVVILSTGTVDDEVNLKKLAENRFKNPNFD